MKATRGDSWIGDLGVLAAGINHTARVSHDESEVRGGLALLGGRRGETRRREL
jgi:hypothetical protein